MSLLRYLVYVIEINTCKKYQMCAANTDYVSQKNDPKGIGWVKQIHNGAPLFKQHWLPPSNKTPKILQIIRLYQRQDMWTIQ